MKRLLGLALFCVIGYYLWKNWFSQLGQRTDPGKERIEEVQMLNEIGDRKRAVALANQVPIATFGDGNFAGIPLTIFTADILKQPKPLTLLPKGTSQNPYDRVV